MGTKSTEILKIVEAARVNGLSDHHVDRLQHLGANPRLLDILVKRSVAKVKHKDLIPRHKESEFSSRAISNLSAGDCWAFNNDIATLLESGEETELCDSHKDSCTSWRSYAFKLLGLHFESDVDIEKALQIADNRLIDGRHRSAAVGYGLIHTLWPFRNPWTLYNWLRSLEHAHADIHYRVKNIIKVP